MLQPALWKSTAFNVPLKTADIKEKERRMDIFQASCRWVEVPPSALFEISKFAETCFQPLLDFYADPSLIISLLLAKDFEFAADSCC